LGNVYVTANVRLEGPITSETDLAAHATELTAVLQDVLDDLRP
jgi:hypothetical protein